MRLLHTSLISSLNDHLIDYPTASIHHIFLRWFLAGICLSVQIITGILLAMHYTPHVE